MDGRAKTPEEWGEDFRLVRASYEGFTGELDKLVSDLLTADEIAFAQVESRTKEVPNFVSKLRRKGEKYDDPLQDVTDLAGLRVIVYYLDDVTRVGEMLKREFDIDAEHSGDKSEALDPDRFGYVSAHYVLRLGASRSGLREWNRYDSLVAEVQVRTVLQHAWAAINRQLNYGSVREAPRDLQRNLSRLSALLELADEQFLEVRRSRETIEDAYDAALGGGDLSLELDESSLDAYLERFQISRRLEELAAAAGAIPMDKAYDAAEARELSEARDRRDLHEVLRMVGVTSIEELHQLVEKALPSAQHFIETLNAPDGPGRGRMSVSPDNWLTLLVLRAHDAPRDAYDAIRYSDELIDAAMRHEL